MTVTYGDIRANFTPMRGGAKTTNAAVQFALPDQAIMSLTPTRPHMQIKAVSGTLWVTQQGDPTDYFLAAGETFTPKQRSGLLVVQAMQDATLRVVE
jgi:hypothetical protein